MGGARWDADDWQTFTAQTSAKPTAQVFQQNNLHQDLNPHGVGIRESRDSTANPTSNAIIVGTDVTGSMGYLAESLVRQGMGVLVEELLNRKPVADPHIMCMGIGDAFTDNAPLQVTQFEADIRIVQQLQQIWLEGGGGGNGGESYLLAWYFAARHTAIDCLEKRQKKGYLFTVGDENPHKILTRDQIRTVFGDAAERDMSVNELLTMVNRMYHVFHLLVEESSSCDDVVVTNWKNLLGERALRLSDHTRMAEVIVSTIAVNEGQSMTDVAQSWGDGTSLVVSRAIGSLAPTDPAARSGKGVMRFFK